ncbi:MAG: JAB domain-containing protein, partial [Clostridia bacterium]|nr:JAB domain-containing protein [Clostridia bacterium]
RNFYFDDINIYESFFIILLNRANKVIGWAKISQGGVCNTIVDKKIICKYAIDTLANGVILVHNHPSGSLIPSREDMQITADVQQALKTLDVKVLDHIILTEKSFYSFSDEGTLS